MTTKKLTGSCHCGHLRFEVEIDARAGSRCNCSICTKIGNVSANVKPAAFTALTDEATLGQYVWGRKIGARYFCKTCGVHAYSRANVPELGGEMVTVNFNCLDDIDVREVEVTHWDGRHDNWQAGPRPTPWPVSRAPVS